VNTKASMVAMSGAIMPAPLATPQMDTGVEPMRVVAAAPFGNVSVVMMARATSCQRPCPASATSLSITFPNLVASSGSPLPPLEGGYALCCGHAAALQARSAVSFVAIRPFLPVNALALPELTTRALARPDLMWVRPQSTAAEGHFDCVKTP